MTSLGPPQALPGPPRTSQDPGFLVKSSKASSKIKKIREIIGILMNSKQFQGLTSGFPPAGGGRSWSACSLAPPPAPRPAPPLISRRCQKRERGAHLRVSLEEFPEELPRPPRISSNCRSGRRSPSPRRLARRPPRMVPSRLVTFCYLMEHGFISLFAEQSHLMPQRDVETQQVLRAVVAH